MWNVKTGSIYTNLHAIKVKCLFYGPVEGVLYAYAYLTYVHSVCVTENYLHT